MRRLIFAIALMWGFSLARADGNESEQAKQFLQRLKQHDLISGDITKLSPEELKQVVQTTHDLCRFGKALRLERFREVARLEGLNKAANAQANWDALYYELNFGINFTSEIISGYVRMRAASLVPGLATVELDLLNSMTVDSVVQNGSALTFSHANDLITVTLNQTYDSGQAFMLYVYYHGHPTEGGFQGFAFSTHSSVEMATTLSEPYFARSWWPCKDRPDDKADSVDIVITHPSSFVCASNGEVVSIVDNGDGTKTTHWSHHYPITTYLVCIGVTNYSSFRNWYIGLQGDSMPVDFYVYPERLSQAQTSYPVTVAMIDTLAHRFGEYPFLNEKYGMLHFDWGGAMEHQTNTSMASSAFYESIIVHELSHQWWGDMITCDNWHEIWLNEGWASYAEALWAEAQGGFTSYRNYMNSMRYTSGGTIWCQDTTDVFAIFSSRVYDKGAWVMHMLRGYVGDSTFFAILHTYYDDPRFKYKTATSAQFRDLCIQVTGDSSLTDFFNDWIWGTYFPQYRYSYQLKQYGPDDWVVYLNIRQLQNTNPTVFHLPLSMYIFDGGTYHRQVVFNNQRDQDFILYYDNQPLAPLSVSLDIYDWVLKSAATESYTLHMIYDPLAPAQQYQPYTDSAIVAGGTPPYTFSVTAGTLPTGLTLNPASGKLTGAPTDTGAFAFTIRVQDSGGPAIDQADFTLHVAPSPFLPGDANSDGHINVADAVFIINYVFVPGSPAPTPLVAGNANCDAEVNVADAVWIVNFVFLPGSPAPGDCK